MMDDPRYEGLLFGDISSVTAHKRIGVLETLLNRTDLHDRLINGTDYPVPAVYVVIWSSQLRRKRLITTDQERILNRIFQYNPLLFDFCLKRSDTHAFTLTHIYTQSHTVTRHTTTTKTTTTTTTTTHCHNHYNILSILYR